MAKAGAFLSALSIFALATVAYSAADEFQINGYVYCDPCRIEFETKLAYPLDGATVKLECKHIDTNIVTYSLNAKTDSTGHYSLIAKGDHGDDLCAVTLVDSPRADCSEPFKGISSARVLLTENSGITGTDRFANPLGFITKEAIAGCKEALDEMGFIPYDQEFNF